MPRWRKAEKQVDELLRQVNDLFDDLGGRLLNEEELKLLQFRLREQYQVRLRFVDKDHTLKELLKDWNRKDRGVVGKFDPEPPPEMILRSDNASELTVFHEMVHLEVWFKKLPKMHIVDEEKLVFEAIWKQKHRWTNDELIDSYLYVNRKAMDFNRTGKNFPKLENPEIEQLIINKQFGII